MASDECKFVKPIIKWVGGKSQLIDKIISTFPKEIINYKEIFIGGGSVLLALLSSDIKITGKIYAYDLNKILINLYKNIQNNPNELYEKVIMFKKIYSNITENIINKNPNNIKEALKSKESYYYWIRKLFNKEKDNTLIKSAMFIFLNKLCFRGMYREGPNGFNVPFGHYKKIPEIINLRTLVGFCTKYITRSSPISSFIFLLMFSEINTLLLVTEWLLTKMQLNLKEEQ